MKKEQLIYPTITNKYLGERDITPDVLIKSTSTHTSITCTATKRPNTTEKNDPSVKHLLQRDGFSQDYDETGSSKFNIIHSTELLAEAGQTFRIPEEGHTYLEYLSSIFFPDSLSEGLCTLLTNGLKGRITAEFIFSQHSSDSLYFCRTTFPYQ